jgi:hypothetical protein
MEQSMVFLPTLLKTFSSQLCFVSLTVTSVLPKIKFSCVLAQFLSQQKYQCETVTFI